MTEKIQKILAGRGLGSRREIEQWLRDGRISVNGKTALLGARATADDQIRIDGRLVRLHPDKTLKSRVLLYHKPEGEICSRHDPEGRPSIFDRLPLLRNGRWVSIGRLDFNTSGILLFTNDGELAHRLMHPSANIEREYAVRVQGQVTAATLTTLKKGVVLDDGPAHFTSISDQGGEGSNHWYHVTVSQGRNRIVRRLFESQGLMVSRLIRIRFGSLLLPRILRRGKWDEMTPAQIAQLFQPAATHKTPPKRHERNDRPKRHTHQGKKTAGRREQLASPSRKPRPFRSTDKKNSEQKKPDNRRASFKSGKDRDHKASRSRKGSDSRPRERSEKTFAAPPATRSKITRWHKYPEAVPAQTANRPKHLAGKRPTSTHARRSPGQATSLRPVSRARLPHETHYRPILSRKKKPE